MIKILHCYDAFLPKTQMWNYNLLINIRAKSYVACKTRENEEIYNHPPDLTYHSENLYRTYVYEEAKTIKVVFKKVLYLLLRWVFSYNRQLSKFIKKNKPDIIHGHFSNVAYELIPLANKHEIPLVVSFYGWDYEMLPFQNPIWYKRYKHLFEKSCAVITEGEHGKKILTQLGCPESKIHVIRLGIEDTESPFPLPADNRSEIYKLIQISSLHEGKGVLEAIKATKVLKDLGIPFRFSIYGEGSAYYVNKLKSLISHLNLENEIQLEGFLPYDKLHSTLNQNHVFIHPSQYAKNMNCEGGAPTVLFDAMSVGLPIISTLHCDIPNVVAHKENGLLSDEGNVDLLSQNLVNIFKLPSEVYKSYCLKSQQIVKSKFNIKNNAQNLSNVYKSLLLTP